jgi:hypothetical protein
LVFTLFQTLVPNKPLFLLLCGDVSLFLQIDVILNVHIVEAQMRIQIGFICVITNLRRYLVNKYKALRQAVFLNDQIKSHPAKDGILFLALPVRPDGWFITHWDVFEYHRDMYKGWINVGKVGE